MSRIELRLISLCLVLAFCNIALQAEIPDGARATSVSGGENHTLVLTAAETVWACGDNSSYQLGIGNSTPQGTLSQVLKGDMNSPTPYIAYIDAVDAGWKHSLVLDVNGFVWAWGNNDSGQIGDSTDHTRTTPVGVHNPMGTGYFGNILSISAGRSGEHSLAIDANDFVWAWGR